MLTKYTTGKPEGQEEKKQTKFPFYITNRKTGQKYFLVAETEQDRNRWLTELNLSIEKKVKADNERRLAAFKPLLANSELMIAITEPMFSLVTESFPR